MICFEYIIKKIKLRLSVFILNRMSRKESPADPSEFESVHSVDGGVERASKFIAIATLFKFMTLGNTLLCHKDIVWR